jgi:hypothetical protein
MQHEWLGEDDYEVEVEVFGQRRRVSCPYTCDRMCGRACAGVIRHSGRCDCRKDCASEAGPFDHLVAYGMPSGAVPAEVLADDTEEIPSAFFNAEEPTR